MKKALSFLMIIAMVFTVMAVPVAAAVPTGKIEIIAPADGEAVFRDIEFNVLGTVSGGAFKAGEIRNVEIPANTSAIVFGGNDNTQIWPERTKAGVFIEITLPSNLPDLSKFVRARYEWEYVTFNDSGAGKFYLWFDPANEEKANIFFDHLIGVAYSEVGGVYGRDVKAALEGDGKVPFHFMNDDAARGYKEGYFITVKKIADTPELNGNKEIGGDSSSSSKPQPPAGGGSSSSTPEKKTHKGSLTTEHAGEVNALFTKYFTKNTFLTADLGIGEPFDKVTAVSVALGNEKIDLSKAVFYSYNKELNSYSKIARPGASIDGTTLTVTNAGTHGTYLVISLNGVIIRLDDEK